MNTQDVDELAVSIKDIHKEFILPQNKNTSMKQAAVNIVRKNAKVTQKVLDGVSFDVNRGDFFGIVGRNGSGKSTLLKLIAGVYYPTAGSIEVNGGLTPFIELGVGFNPELSGRDNVYLNGALLGFTRKEMDEMYDEIVDFAELGPFMDQKLKNYSSGMQVRLAFSIAIKAKNDVLIFDEVLAVGDEAFQRKCLDVFESYKASGQTVILVTHDMETVKKYCNRAALIHEGSLVKQGNPIIVADEYSRLNQLAIDESNRKNNAGVQEFEYHDKRIKLDLLDDEGKQEVSFSVGQEVEVRMEWDPEINADRILLDLYTKAGEHVTNFISSREGIKSLKGEHTARLRVTLNLTPGSYFFAIGLWEAGFKRRITGLSPARSFVISKDWSMVKHEFAGLTCLESKWIEK